MPSAAAFLDAPDQAPSRPSASAFLSAKPERPSAAAFLDAPGQTEVPPITSGAPSAAPDQIPPDEAPQGPEAPDPDAWRSVDIPGPLTQSRPAMKTATQGLREDATIRGLKTGLDNLYPAMKAAVGGFLRSTAEAAPRGGTGVGFDLNDPQYTEATSLARAFAASPDNPVAGVGREIYKAAREEIEANTKAGKQGIDPNSLDGYAFDIANGAVQLAPIIATSLVTKSPAIGLTGMGGQIYGEQYGAAREAGRTVEQASQDAAFYTTAQTMPYSTPLGILTREGGEFAPRILQAMGAQGLQSMFSEALQIGYEKGILDKDMTWGEAWERIKHAGIVGTVTGGTLAVATHPFTREPTLKGDILSPEEMRQRRQDEADNATYTEVGTAERGLPAPKPPEEPPPGGTPTPEGPAGPGPGGAPIDIAKASISELAAEGQRLVEEARQPLPIEGEPNATGERETLGPTPLAPANEVGGRLEGDLGEPGAGGDEKHGDNAQGQSVLEPAERPTTAQAVTPKADRLAAYLGATARPYPTPTRSAAAFLDQTDEPAGDGTRENPVKVQSAEDVTRAEGNVDLDASHAAKSAEVSRSGHMIVKGLDITIENPKGDVREGRDEDGKLLWSTVMPATYGRIKGTVGGDGDHFDVYVGPNPQSDQVFVIDQIDPKTKDFDEHKAVLGTDSEKQALAIYDGGFSDGSGPSRRGAVTEMSVPEFRTYLKTGDTANALTYRKGEVPATTPGEPVKSSQANLPATGNEGKMFVEVGRKRYPVDTIQQASEMYSKARDTHGGGGSEVPSVSIVDPNGKEIAKVSYNGKVWPAGEWQRGMKPLYDPYADTRDTDRAEMSSLGAEARRDLGKPPLPGDEKILGGPQSKAAIEAKQKDDLAEVGATDLAKKSTTPKQDALKAKMKRGGKPTFVDQMENYYQPGSDHAAYGGTRDKVVSFSREGIAGWAVKVREIGKDGRLGPVRTHWTPPSRKDLAAWEKTNPVPQHVDIGPKTPRQKGDFKADMERSSLVEMIAGHGGINDEFPTFAGEMKSRDLHKLAPFVPGMGRRSLVRRGGMDLDTAADLAQQYGHISERDTGTLLDALEQDAKAIQEKRKDQRVYAAGDDTGQASVLAARQGRDDEVAQHHERRLLEEEADGLGIDHGMYSDNDALRRANDERADEIDRDERNAIEALDAIAKEVSADEQGPEFDIPFAGRERARPEAAGDQGEARAQAEPANQAEAGAGDRLKRGADEKAGAAEAVDRTEQGEQRVIPGAEQRTGEQVAEAKVAEAVANKAEEARVEQQQSKLRRGNQKSVKDQEGGLFDSGRDQGDLLGPKSPSGKAATTIPAVRDKAAKASPEILKDLQDRLTKLGLSDKVAVRVVDHINNVFQNGKQATAFGAYESAKKLITVSLEGDGQHWVLSHEVVHVLRDLGLIRDAEWTSLVKKAEATPGLREQVESDYAGMGLTDEQIQEEMVANLNADKAEAAKQAGFIRQAWERIKAVLRSIRDAFRAQGIRTADDIFRDIESGEVGRREPAERAERPDAPAMAAIKAESTRAQQALIETAGRGKDLGKFLDENGQAMRNAFGSLHQEVADLAREMDSGRGVAATIKEAMDRHAELPGEFRVAAKIGDAETVSVRANALIDRLRAAGVSLPDAVRALSPGGHASIVPSGKRGIDVLRAIQETTARIEHERDGQEGPLAGRGAIEGSGSDQALGPRPLYALRNSTDPKDPIAARNPIARLVRSTLDRFADHGGRELAELGISVLRDARMKIVPMVNGTVESRSAAKDFANYLRFVQFKYSRLDAMLKADHTPERRAEMGSALDEQSVHEQDKRDVLADLEEGQREAAAERMDRAFAGKGLDRLNPDERRTAEILSHLAEDVWSRMYEVGIVKTEHGLPSYMPRMLVNLANDGSFGRLGGEGESAPLDQIGRNLSTKGPMKREYRTAEETEAAAKAKFGPSATLVTDIRALPLALARAERAIAGKNLVNAIRELSAQAQSDLVSDHSTPENFTLDHPALKQWRPAFTEDENGNVVPVKDADGNVVMRQYPIYIHKDFEGPLRAVLTTPSGALYNMLMQIKQRAMLGIMYSPMIHNQVEWGRALEAAPSSVSTLSIYFRGNKVKEDPIATQEAIVDGGLVPVGTRGGYQDITGIAEDPQIKPGRGILAKGLAYPLEKAGAENAGLAVRRAIDTAGDWWHGTLLWDRVADLQWGLYDHFLQEKLEEGWDRKTAVRFAAHQANRFAGSLPAEAMSSIAQKIANVALFSKTFTLGNIGVTKDALLGLPKDVASQIERDAGVLTAKAANNATRALAIRSILLGTAIAWALESILQDFLTSEDKAGWGDVAKDMGERLKGKPGNDALQRLTEKPFRPSTWNNEPGKEDRVLVGHDDRGTGIYVRLPAGKVSEDSRHWFTDPTGTLWNKLSTLVKPLVEVGVNKDFSGHRIAKWDDTSPMGIARSVGNVAAHLAEAQVPWSSMVALYRLAMGKDATEDTLRADVSTVLGPLIGITTSHGYPGGPRLGAMHHAEQRARADKFDAMPEINKMIINGDLEGAHEAMRELGMKATARSKHIRDTLNPSRTITPGRVKSFEKNATEAEKSKAAQ